MKYKTMPNNKYVKALSTLLIYIINYFLIYSVLKMHFNNFKIYAVLLVGIVFFVTFVVSFFSKTNCIHLKLQKGRNTLLGIASFNILLVTAFDYIP